METKHELLVFNKKEVGIILMLLGLVALFSFTLGIKLGKRLGATKPVEQAAIAVPPLTAAKPKAEHAAERAAEAAKEPEESASPAFEEDANLAAAAEEKADAALEKEIENTHAGAGKVLSMSLPAEKLNAETKKTESPKSEKKTEKAAAGKYTLQIGSYRTLKEATEQVGELKKKGLDAFYVEAQIPGKGTWYRVGVGVFANKDMAEKTAARWKTARALPPHIVQKIDSGTAE
ncbi:MAG: SPOR domain-containing protein [Deltaproteobacteria bacterium]|nr:SPOR domain-containing protein [Deltaproteobacteria bacterium]